MLFRHAIEKVKGLGYVFNCMEPQSALGKNFLLDMKYLHQKQDIENALDEVENIYTNCFCPEKKEVFSLLKLKLSQLRDIRGTCGRLYSTSILNDIELFEIKHFCLLATEMAAIVQNLNLSVVQIPNLSEVIDVLDPNYERINSFYIYDSYSEDLATLRKQLKAEKTTLENFKPDSNIAHFFEKEKCVNELFQKTEILETNVRVSIFERLQLHREVLGVAMENLARLDALVAKATLAAHFHLCKPIIGDEKTIYKKIFNPYLKQLLESENKRYQAIDIEFGASPTLITGANMAGKTILLKTILLAQYLFQFGFFVPAAEATIVSVEEILFSLEDFQSEKKGLSSFAAEILSVNEILKAAETNKNLLVIVDELAHTTNPVEGRAIVNSMLDFLELYGIRSLITTHYSGITSRCRKLRVKGFVQNADTTTPITKDNISDYIDYSLTEDTDEIVPMEALRIASILGVSAQFLEKAEIYIKKSNY